MAPKAGLWYNPAGGSLSTRGSWGCRPRATRIGRGLGIDRKQQRACAGRERKGGDMCSFKRGLLIISTLVLTVLIVCGCKKAGGVPAEEVSKPDEALDTSKYERYLWPDGSAKVTYEYVYDDPPSWVATAYADIPVKIEIPTDCTEPSDCFKGPFRVHGENEGTLYTTYYAGAHACFIQCDFTGTYRVDGEFRIAQDSDDPHCYFSLSVSATFDPNKVARYGNCPAVITQEFTCAILLAFPQNQKGNPRVFARGTDPEVATHTVPFNSKATEKVTLSDVILPDIEIPTGVTCGWAE